MNALDVEQQTRAAVDRRCNCPPCDHRFPYGVEDDGKVLLRECGMIHHDQRGRFHERKRPHLSFTNRRQRREPLQKGHGPEGAEE